MVTFGIIKSSNRATDRSTLKRDVSSAKSGQAGTSNGADIPVKFRISPFRALAYNPFTSRRSHSSNGVLTAVARAVDVYQELKPLLLETWK